VVDKPTPLVSNVDTIVCCIIRTGLEWYYWMEYDFYVP